MSRRDQPRSEPEIIPPDHGACDGRRGFGAQGAPRAYIARLGPLGSIVALALVAALSLAMLVLLSAFLVFWLPLLVLVVAGMVIATLLRALFWREP